jgi:Carboxypeptidase regulatory-like domain
VTISVLFGRERRNLLNYSRIFRSSSWPALLLGLCSLTGLPAFGQLTSGNLVGTIYDQSGATVPGASVAAINAATNIENKTVSGSAGEYRFSNLPVGSYTLSVEAPGFTKTVTQGVAVQLNLTGTSNITLGLGKAATTVEVSGVAAAIDTSTAQIQTTFESKQLADLPSASGGQANSGVLNVSLLAAGVTSSGGAGYGTGPSVGGQRPTNNNFTVEGIDNNSLAVTGPIVSVPNDAVAEFSVLQNQFSADFGHSSGGQFNEVVKSGSNEFHGMLYEYFQNRNLDAADTLSAVQGTPAQPRYDSNRFGGNFGGPIKRNKLFFFVDYEYNPIGSTGSTAYYAPTQAGYATLAGIPGVNQNNLSQFQKYLGAAAVAAPFDTLPNGAPVQVGGLTIPVGLVSSSLPVFSNTENGVGAIDYNISDKDSLRGRFILNRLGASDAAGFPGVFFGVQPNNGYLATVSEYHTFTPTLTNELRLGFNRQFQDFPIFGNQSFPGLDQFPNINVYELNAAFGPDPNAPQFTIQNIYQIADNVSWSRGGHTVKFGFDGWSSISPSSFTQRARGDYEWGNFSNYLFDTIPDQVAQRSLGNVTYYQNQKLLSGFVNDIWKVNPHLTLNLGLRYEYMSNPTGENAQILNASANVPGLITFNKPSAQTTNFMPRVGIAYSPGTSGKTSIRAGFGITYDVLYNNLGTLSLPPQLSTTVDVSGKAGSGFLTGGGIAPGTSVAVPQGADAIAATAGFIPDQKRPAAYNWNFGIQHAFGSNYVFESRYVGTRGLYLPIQAQINFQPTVNSANALPVYTSAPSQATLNSLSSTLSGLTDAFNNGGYIVPAYANAGFVSPITAFMPQGNSIYHGWSNSLSRRFSNGLQFQGSYTWSHNIDDSTDTLNSTVLSPRRPQDSQNIRAERASSLLDHRNRIVFQVMYDLPYFKSRSWWLKNIVGNWEIAPVYIYQTGELVTAQSAIDSNLNLDSAPDRVIINSAGNNSIGSGVTPLLNSNRDTVAYLANNPNAGYITAPKGTLPNAGRNTMSLNPINDIDLTAVKRIALTERFKLEFSARAFNIFNHPQYTGGYLNDVAPSLNGGQGASNGLLQRTTLEPGSSIFQQWNQAFSSNPRQMQLALKLTF